MHPDDRSTDESTAAVIAEVFLCVLRPTASRIAGRWRRAGVHPWRWVVAAVTTLAWSLLAVVYAVVALVVPLTYALLLTISAPVVIVAELQRHLGARP